MPFLHYLLILSVILIWGFNFLFVKYGLDEIPPLLLCALRFLLVSLPAIFFVKLERNVLKLVAQYGCVMFGLQFSLVFMGMSFGMTPGMASLLMQVQVFFSMLFAAFLLGEVPTPGQMLGALVSFSGIGLVALHFDRTITGLGFVFVLAAAASWGFGNLITKKASHVPMATIIAWGSFIAAFPMLGLSLWLEGPREILQSYARLNWEGVGAIFYIVYASTWIGYGIWNWLLRHYPVGKIVPFTLLTPLVGILSSIFFLGEPFQSWKLVAILLVLGGLCINLVGERIYER